MTYMTVRIHVELCNNVLSCSTKGLSLIVIIFKIPRSMLGGGGQWSPYAYIMFDYDALHFHMGSVKSTFSKYSFGREGGVTKRVLCVCFL